MVHESFIFVGVVQMLFFMHFATKVLYFFCYFSDIVRSNHKGFYKFQQNLLVANKRKISIVAVVPLPKLLATMHFLSLQFFIVFIKQFVCH